MVKVTLINIKEMKEFIVTLASFPATDHVLEIQRKPNEVKQWYKVISINHSSTHQNLKMGNKHGTKTVIRTEMDQII